MRRVLPTLSTLGLVLFGCGGDDSREMTAGNTSVTQGTITVTGNTNNTEPTGGPTTTGPVTGGTDETSVADTGTPMSTSSGPGNTTGPDPKFDVGGNETGVTTGAPDKGCKKVDFLFVIDNSASMEDNQAALVASFPGFIDAIQNQLEDADDYHIMVVDSDDDGRCVQPCDVNGPNYVEYCSVKMAHACKAKLTDCDTTRGAGVLHPVGLYASNQICPVTAPNRYMLPDQPDLLGTFACVATVGTAGNPSERPMNGMTEALSATLNGPGGCNEGFLRDDAILVITFISDDPNYEDIDGPQQWYDAVLAAKKGNKDAVVVAGLIPQPDMGCGAGGKPPNGAHWAEFIAMWGDHGVPGAVCEPDYAPFFSTAVGVIADTCDNFIPPA